MPCLQRLRKLSPCFVVLFLGICLGSNLRAAVTSRTNGEWDPFFINEKKHKSSEGTPSHDESGLSWTIPAANVTGPFYHNRSQASLRFHSDVQFIFTIGLEGTGHHLMGSIIQNSPSMERLKRYNIWPDDAQILQESLFHDYNPDSIGSEHFAGLLNAHCWSESNPVELRQKVVRKLKTIEKKAKDAIRREATTTTTTVLPNHLPFPISSFPAQGSSGVGEISYPNSMGPCRELNYPDMNLFYDACERAQVDCFQVYLYRHPVEILQSVVERGFSSNDTSTMQLYMANLHVLASQLRHHADKTLGCFGFYEAVDSDVVAWSLEAQQDLWGWENASQYQAFIQRTYRRPTHSTHDNEAKLDAWRNHSPYGPYMNAWWNIHQHTIDTCRRVVNGVI